MANIGCGKSVLAGYLQEHLIAEDSNAVLYRFQRSASNMQATPTSFASSLISHLLETSTGLSPGTPACEQHQKHTTQNPQNPQQNPFKMLWSIVTSLLKMSRPHVY